MNKYTVYNKSTKKTYNLSSKYLHRVIKKANQMQQEPVLVLEIALNDTTAIQLDAKLSLKKVTKEVTNDD
jgi:hypothetical protein